MKIDTLFIGQKLIYLKSVGSTNDFAMEMISDISGAVVEGTVIIAEHQTMGKGQFNRIWETEEGKNLTFSCILSPKFLKAEEQFFLNKCIAVSLVQTLQKFTNKHIEIKWPNDILLNNKKICGVLIENKLKKNQLEHAVIGIGLNVNQTDFPSEFGATSLALAENKVYDKNEVLNVFLSVMEANYIKLRKYKYSFDDVYLSNLKSFQKQQTFQVHEKQVTLFVDGVNAYGQLITKDKNGRQQTWLSGELKWV